jgi:hypothetical protein
MFLGEFSEHAVDLVIELADLLLPLQAEEVHLSLMGLLKLSQLIFMSKANLLHLAVLQLLLEHLHLPLEALSFNVLSSALAVLLPCDGLLAASEGSTSTRTACRHPPRFARSLS